jgi:phenylacetate-CoA ligase
MFLREAATIPVPMVRQYLPRGLIERRKLRGVNAMLAYCRRRVPFYRADERYHRGPLRELAELAELPVLPKATLRERPPEELLAEGIGKRHEYRTSGSTGTLVVGYHDEASHDYHEAACFRRWIATGKYLPTDRLTAIRQWSVPDRVFQKRLKLFRRRSILSNLPLAQIKAELLASRPHVLQGWPTHLRRVLRALTPEELAQLRRTLKFVFSDSELLTDEHRAVLTQGYGVPVFDEYSAFEVLNIYFECSAGGRHIAEDRVHVEILGEDDRPLPPGTEGRVVVTAYMERATPLVRYELGDIGLLDVEPCRCRRTLRTMRLTKGRTADIVVLPDGRLLYPDVLLRFSETFPNIAECFVHQDAAGRVRMNIVPLEATAGLAEMFDGVRREVFKRAGGPFDLEVVRADEVPLTVGGKGKFVTSDFRKAPETQALRRERTLL